MSLTVNPSSVVHASNRGLPKSAASASSNCVSRASTRSQMRSRVARRHASGLVEPVANAARAASTFGAISWSGVTV